MKDTAVLEPEFKGLDAEAKAKAIMQRKLSNKKEDRWEVAKKKIEENKKKRLAAKAEKDQEKAKKKGTKR